MYFVLDLGAKFEMASWCSRLDCSTEPLGKARKEEPRVRSFRRKPTILDLYAVRLQTALYVIAGRH